LGQDLAIIRLGALNHEASGLRVDVRLDAKFDDVRGVARFEEHCLPDPAGAGVPAPLFADRLLLVVHQIFDA
jgi:hypothetical protein